MRHSTTATNRAAWPRYMAALALAAAAALVTASRAEAQASPYESSMRTTVGTGIGQQPMAQGLVFQPRLDLALQYVDNINLASSGTDKVNTGGVELAPGLYASYDSSYFTGAIDYSIIGHFFDNSDYNDTQQVGAANGRWKAIPDLFYIDGQASMTDVVNSPALSLNFGQLGIFGQDNLSQQATAGISPTFDRRFGEFTAYARYSYGRVWYFNQGTVGDTVGVLNQDNSKDQSATVSLGNTESERKLTGRVSYDWQKTDYDNALPYNYERLGLDAAWRVVRTVSLLAGFGAESELDQSTTDGGLGSNFWDAGLRWDPDGRTSVEARAGHRFFGTSYYGSIFRRARMFEFTASYSETPQVQTQILSVGDFTPGELPPGVGQGVNFGRLNSQPYVGKNASANVSVVGARTTVTVSAYRNVQDFVESGLRNDTWSGAGVTATRRLASNLSGSLTVSYSSYDQSILDPDTQLNTSSTTDYTQVVGELDRDSAGGKLTTSLQAGYLDSSGTGDINTYNGWWAGLRLRWKP
jgi:hypothetical protein